MRKFIIAGFLAFLPSLAFGAQLVTPCAKGISSAYADSCADVIQPQSTASAVESSHVFKSSGPATVVEFEVNNTSASPVWVMVFDASTAPTAGAVTGCNNASASRPCVSKWYYVAANATQIINFAPGPYPQMQSGLVLACSSTGPFTLTYSANCTFSGQAM